MRDSYLRLFKKLFTLKVTRAGTYLQNAGKYAGGKLLVLVKTH